MANLKSKRKQEAKIEELGRKTSTMEHIKAVEESSNVVETTSPSPYLNEAEQTALAEQHEKDTADSKKVSTEKMQRAVEVVSDHFNLYDKDFSVNGFSDKGSKCQLSMSNEYFDIVITVKDTEKFAII